MAAPRAARSTSHATLVAAGIFLSRVFGLVRQRALAHYLGLGDASDAFNAAFRIPNLLRDLFAEGALSTAFVTVFSRTFVTPSVTVPSAPGTVNVSDHYGVRAVLSLP